MRDSIINTILREVYMQRPELISEIVENPAYVFNSMGLAFKREKGKKKVTYYTKIDLLEVESHYYIPKKGKYKESIARRKALMQLFLKSLDIIAIAKIAKSLKLHIDEQ